MRRERRGNDGISQGITFHEDCAEELEDEVKVFFTPILLDLESVDLVRLNCIAFSV